MLDKLVLKSKEVFEYNQNDLDKLNVNFDIFQVPDRYYEKCYRLKAKESNINICLKYSPRYGSGKVRIELNPSHFINIRSVIQTVQQVYTGKLNIHRVDCCADVEVSITELVNQASVSRKKSRIDYKNTTEIESAYWGKTPHQILIYKKKNKTRIEVRFFNKKVPYNDFDKINEYKDFEPFNSINFLKVDLSKQNTCKNILLASFIDDAVGIQGYMSMKKIINKLSKNSNFQRDFKKYFVHNEDIPCLNQIYKKNVESFFQGGY